MDARSHVEILFPHIAKGLGDNWKYPGAIREYLNHLSTDERGGRAGFPAEVFDELMFLSDLRWQLDNPDADHVDIFMDAFRFGVNPDKKRGNRPT